MGISRDFKNFGRTNFFTRTASNSVGWAADRRLFTGAIHYCTVRELLPAPCPTWASALRLRRPGGSGLPSPTISTPCLARTPDQHREAEDRTPNLTPSDSPSPPSSWITRPSHVTRRFNVGLNMIQYNQQKLEGSMPASFKSPLTGINQGGIQVKSGLWNEGSQPSYFKLTE
ncbi:hypothetical protein CEXT_268491 [Caerostris extrusa]|uniref:Uncharacterized protein n=1 Tax=Caerostris extrusa TaxID=172846 RepID=A0AAV4T699_CAEEX|nr:hypothetical protein CEXT_268491 [Caerostris extrusa]